MPGGAQGPEIDWAHVRDLAERTKGPRGPGLELVIASAGCDDIPVDEMPELEDEVRQARLGESADHSGAPQQ